MKAIHNGDNEALPDSIAVSATTKIHFESNSQLDSLNEFFLSVLSAPLQRYILKAIHNRHEESNTISKLSAPLQRYILKAIHNICASATFNTSAVSATTKIHFESNSQLLDGNLPPGMSCQRHYKDTF